MTEAPKPIFCDRDTVEEVIHLPHERPIVPRCLRTNRHILGALVVPPCAEIGYCIETHLGE